MNAKTRGTSFVAFYPSPPPSPQRTGERGEVLELPQFRAGVRRAISLSFNGPIGILAHRKGGPKTPHLLQAKPGRSWASIDPSERACGMKLTKLPSDPGVSDVAAEGYIQALDFPAGGPNPLAAILGENWAAGAVILDFSHVTGIGSAGIGWLIQTQATIKSGGGRMVLHSIKPQVQQQLALFKKAFKAMHLVSDRAAAMQLLATPPV